MAAKVSAKSTMPAINYEWYEHPLLGQTLTICFGLCFLFQCMILPIVGPAAMRGSGSPGATTALYAHANFTAFLSMLLVTLLAGGAALYSKVMRRQKDQSPFPYATAGLLGVSVALLFCLVAGLLKI